jgi:acetolactate synthase regulatory subunit
MCHCPQKCRLEIIADSDPTLLARICGILGGLSLIPARFDSASSADAESLHITVVLASCTPRLLDLIYRKLSQLTSVRSVSLDGGN